MGQNPYPNELENQLWICKSETMVVTTDDGPFYLNLNFL
jgi:hypothetical protein